MARIGRPFETHSRAMDFTLPLEVLPFLKCFVATASSAQGLPAGPEVWDSAPSLQAPGASAARQGPMHVAGGRRSGPPEGEAPQHPASRKGRTRGPRRVDPRR